MCDWLSRNEWCDVRLLCGGRAFSAHRAVLASVSSFLRRLLLSCPIDETPTLIVLPDFDLEAMSAVLYYIYNGEVTMPRQKIEKFIEIIKAMQIFIDRQYLTQLCVSIGEIECNLAKCVPDDDRIFILRAEDDKEPLVTFKKLSQRDISQCHSRDEVDYSNLQAPAQNWNEHFKSCLGNLQSSHGDRQRDYFLRDSFMETYPRNRNANGRAAGVPAISNGSYHGPTSPLLTNPNANGYLSTDDASQPSAERTIDAGTRAHGHLNLAIHYFNNPYSENALLPEMRSNLSIEDVNDVWTRHQKVPMLPPVEGFQHRTERKRMSYLDLSFIQKATGPELWSQHGGNGISVVEKNLDINIANTKEILKRSHNKVAILNKALDNPWCPRLPNSFRPFRRKSCSKMPNVKNDNNNNIEATPALSVKEESFAESTDAHNNVHFPSSTAEDDKAHANNQFLLSTDPASSRPTRYACTECGKTFSQLRNFKYHMSVHRGTKEFAASCSVCGKCFNDRGYLSSHMKIHRNRKEYKCSQCPKSFNQRVAYNMHVRIHTGIKPHECQQCGKAFSRKMLLKQHQRTHSGERPYACPHCDKRFADRSNMTLHLRLHSGIKPFKCPMCPKSFTKKHHLKSHVNFHTGAKPYSCPRCKLAFTQSSNMRTHLKRCTAPEPGRGEQSASA